MKYRKLALHKMRGVIDPYTLGFLISLIAATVVYIGHSDKQSEDVTSISIDIKDQAVVSREE